MTKETLLMQYQSECLSALKSVANIHKPFEKTFMDTMKLFMAIPDRINFLQLGRYGCFSEQTYRNLFEHETFDWFAFNGSIISKHLTGKRKAIAIDPSLYSQIRQEDTLDRLLLVRLCRRIQAWTGNHGHRCH
ncbi:hypothetical protein NXV09_15795 [Parabacteroides distasonis]|nr:hypothetical protein [Parabacteroides distasonis]MCS2462361.1 hypothetical protein [Parabacteroides distasonis]